MTDDLLLGDLSDDEIEALASTLTPNLGLPYPSSNDPVAAGATNIRDLALAIDGNSKLVGLATPVIAIDAGLRVGAYAGEIVLFQFYGPYWHAQHSVAALARWSDMDGAGNKWWILGGPVVLKSQGDADFAVPAGTNNDGVAYLDLPKWVRGWLSGNCLNYTNSLIDLILTDSASHNSYWSCAARGWTFATPSMPADLGGGVLQGRCYLQYYSPSGGTVRNRGLSVNIVAVIA